MHARRASFCSGLLLSRRLLGCQLVDCRRLELLPLTADTRRAKLDNCIVGPGARIGDRAQLKDCTVAPNAVIEPEANLKGESILADE